MRELEIVRHSQIDGMSIFFDTVDYRTPHFHPEWELIWIMDGRLSIRLGADGCVGTKGELFLFGPGTIHEFQKIEESATFLCLQVSPQLFEKAYPGFLHMMTEDFRVNPYLGEKERARLQNEMAALMAAYLEQPPFYELLCLGRCALLLSDLLQAMPCHSMGTEELATTDKRNARLARFIRFVDENYTQNIHLSDFAKAEGCSVSYISRFIKTSLNQNFQEYVNSVRYHSACKLIAAGGMKMLDVCEESGFSDYRYFSAAFKTRSGMTPEEYSRQAVKPEAGRAHHSLHSLERFYTREESLALLKKLRS